MQELENESGLVGSGSFENGLAARRVSDVQDELLSLVRPIWFIKYLKHGIMSYTGLPRCTGLCSRLVHCLLREPVQLSITVFVWFRCGIRGDASSGPRQGPAPETPATDK